MQIFRTLRKVSTLSPEQHRAHLANTKKLLDSVENYFLTMKSRPVLPVKDPIPIPKVLPVDPVPFDSILNTIENSVYPNNLHWQHPMFFGWLPHTISWESIQGVILAKALGSVNFTKFSCPIGNEIEICVSD